MVVSLVTVQPIVVTIDGNGSKLSTTIYRLFFLYYRWYAVLPLVVCSSLNVHLREASSVQKVVSHYLQKTEGDIMVIDVRSVPYDFHARYIKHMHSHIFIGCYEEMTLCQPSRKSESGICPRNLMFWLCRKHSRHSCAVMILVPSGQLSARLSHQPELLGAAVCQAKSPTRTLDVLIVSEMCSITSFPPMLENKQINSSASFSLSDNPVTDSHPATSDQHKIEYDIEKLLIKDLVEEKGTLLDGYCTFTFFPLPSG